MNCKDVRERLLFYLDNELTLKQKEAIETHLSGCLACQKELNALSKTQDLLSQGFRTLSSQTAPLWAWVELEQRLARLSEEGTSRVKGIITGIKSFALLQPGWKLILSGAMAIALVISSIVLIPKLTAPSPEAQAKQIAEETPEVVALAGYETSATETEVSGTTGYVLTSSAAGESNLAYVDLQKGSVTRLFRITTPPLTEDDRTQAQSIARTNPNTKRILDSGGTISDIAPLPPHLRLGVVDGQPVIWTEGVVAGAVLRVNSLTWLARIDVGGGKVLDVSMLAPPSPKQHVEQPFSSYSKEELIEIAKSDAKASALFEQGAEAAHVAVGHGRMATSGAIILRLDDEAWSVRIDLNSHVVTRVELIPKAKQGKSNIFNPR